MRKNTLALAALLVAGSVTLAACGGGDDDAMSGMSHTDSSSSSPSSDEATNFNDADVTFATDMIPHHRQAVEMAKLAEGRAQSAAVKQLASQIMDAQDPEIEKMSGWLEAWGKPVPDEMSDMSDMDHSGSMSGMMSTEDMDSLKNATGAEFDQMFLTMMTAHHQGAIEMAKTEQSDGSNTDAIALAGQIEQAQTQEIATMRGLLK